MDRDPSHPMQFFAAWLDVVSISPYLSYSSCFDENTKREKFVKNRKIQPHVPFKGTTAGDVLEHLEVPRGVD